MASARVTVVDDAGGLWTVNWEYGVGAPPRVVVRDRGGVGFVWDKALVDAEPSLEAARRWVDKFLKDKEATENVEPA